MQRLANAALSLALILFVSAVSLALLAAAWLMATPILNGLLRSSLPKWVFIGLLIMGSNRVNAQTSTADMYTVTEAYTKQLNDRPVVPQVAVVPPDTLSQSAQRNVHRQKRRISPDPKWPSDTYPSVATPRAPDVSSEFYIMSIAPNPSAYKPGYWFRSRP